MNQTLIYREVAFTRPSFDILQDAKRHYSQQLRRSLTNAEVLSLILNDWHTRK